MQLTPKISLSILAATAVVCSKAFFIYINDPEGANLLISVGLAVFLYVVSLLSYLSKLSTTKKLAAAVAIQVLVTVLLCVFLK